LFQFFLLVFGPGLSQPECPNKALMEDHLWIVCEITVDPAE